MAFFVSWASFTKTINRSEKNCFTPPPAIGNGPGGIGIEGTIMAGRTT
jgi:hypothetical protein